MSGEAIGEGTDGVLVEAPGLKGRGEKLRVYTMKKVQEQLLWKHSLVAVKDYSTLEMPGPEEDHQEQQQLWSGVGQRLEDRQCVLQREELETPAPWLSPEDC